MPVILPGIRHFAALSAVRALRFGEPHFSEEANHATRTIVFAACARGDGLLIVSIATLRLSPFQGGMRGTVRDSGGVIPGVPLTLVNEQNNVPRETVTNEVGEYSFPALDPGSYTIRATRRDSALSSGRASLSERSNSSRSTSCWRSAHSRKRLR
jgi:hypothetical protein